MKPTAEAPLGAILATAWADLAPFAGRMAQAWRIAALCALATLVFMTYQIPEAAIACYLIFFIMKADAAESVVMATAVAILVSLVVGLLLLLANFTIEAPPWRLVVLVLSSFLFLYLGVASQVGPVGSIVALVVAFAMTLLSDAPSGEVVTRGLLYAWLMAATPMALIVGFNLCLGRSTHRLLRAGIAERLTAAATALEDTGVDLSALVHEGNDTLAKRAGFVRTFRLAPANEAERLTAAVPGTYRLLLAVSALPAATPSSVRQALATQCRALAAAFATGEKILPMATACSDVETGAKAVQAALAALACPTPDPGPAPRKPSFMAADAWTNPDYQHYALKATGAAVICYLIYTALDWQDIHTAMITCYVVALGTTGETVHKLTLRIIGCLVGAGLGIGSVIFLIPHMTSVAELAVLVFCGSLFAAWVAVGNERVSYAGVQIALAFLMTVLQGFGPNLQLSIAFDRVAGIILGNVVMYMVFTHVWAVSVERMTRTRLGQAMTGLERLAQLPGRAWAARMAEAAEVERALADARRGLELAAFEPARIRPSPTRRRELRALLADIEALSPRLAMASHGGAPAVVALQRLAARLERAGVAPPTEHVTTFDNATVPQQQAPRPERSMDD